MAKEFILLLVTSSHMRQSPRLQEVEVRQTPQDILQIPVVRTALWIASHLHRRIWVKFTDLMASEVTLNTCLRAVASMNSMDYTERSDKAAAIQIIKRLLQFRGKSLQDPEYL